MSTPHPIPHHIPIHYTDTADTIFHITPQRRHFHLHARVFSCYTETMKYVAPLLLALFALAAPCAAQQTDGGAPSALAKLLAAEAQEKQELADRITALEAENAGLYEQAVKEGHKRKQLFLQMARNKLEMMRAALRMYFIDHGTFPPSLTTLVPRYIREVPELGIAPGPGSSKVFLLKKDVYHTDLFAAVGKGNGGWLYVTDKKSARWGDVCINSKRLTIEGKYAYQY